MGIIYIGDRQVGKTHLAMELANPNNQHVQVVTPSYDSLKTDLYDEGRGETRATSAVDSGVDSRPMVIQVELPTGKKQITLDWVDTPGEIWRKAWQDEKPDKWQEFLDTIRMSEGILLIVPPHRDLLLPSVAPDKFITRQQWCNRFERWAEFFNRDCPKARHIVICLNKADLFKDINLKKEGKKLAFDPDGASMNWQDRHMYVLSRYFSPVQSQLAQINQKTSGLSVRCFITSIHNRSLLELPWIYLGSFLGH